MIEGTSIIDPKNVVVFAKGTLFFDEMGFVMSAIKNQTAGTLTDLVASINGWLWATDGHRIHAARTEGRVPRGTYFVQSRKPPYILQPSERMFPDIYMTIKAASKKSSKTGRLMCIPNTRPTKAQEFQNLSSFYARIIRLMPPENTLNVDYVTDVFKGHTGTVRCSYSTENNEYSPVYFSMFRKFAMVMPLRITGWDEEMEYAHKCTPPADPVDPDSAIDLPEKGDTNA